MGILPILTSHLADDLAALYLKAHALKSSFFPLIQLNKYNIFFGSLNLVLLFIDLLNH